MTKVIILAAGIGSRLRPYTDTMPKGMVPLAGIPMLQRQLDVINQYIDKDNIAIVTGYKPECIEPLGYKTLRNENYETTNMVYSLFQAEKFMSDTDDLIIAYSDIVYQADVFEKVVHDNNEMAVVIDTEFRHQWEIRSENPIDDTESLKLDSDGNVLELGQKVTSMREPEGQYVGLIKVSKSHINWFIQFFNTLQKNCTDRHDFQNMYMTDFIQYIINSGQSVKAIKIEKSWLEVDTTEDLEIYHKLYKSGELNKIIRL